MKTLADIGTDQSYTKDDSWAKDKVKKPETEVI